jgi:[acyl-carrier-protein] S-malonyltransferase
MGKDLCAASERAAEVFAQADDLLGTSISRLCFDGPAEELNDTANTQPALLIVSVAALHALRERSLGEPAYVAGHSLGEFSALVAADSLSFAEALHLVRERGRLMKEAGQHSPGGMAAVLGLDTEEVDDICASIREAVSGYVGVANDNCPGQVVISGEEQALEAAVEAAQAAGARRVRRLAVSIAAHSPLMTDAAVSFREALAGVTLRPPKIPLVANATAGPLTDPVQIRQALERQLTSPVRWAESVRWMADQGVTRFIEVGPGDVLTGLVRRIDGTAERLTTQQALATAA